MTTLETERLLLRRWKPSDLPSFAALNQDPEVMRFFPRPLTARESHHLVERIEEHFTRHGFGLWALERRDNHVLVGFTGLMHSGFETHFTPCVEIGWRLARSAWGQGMAREAARAALAHGFAELALEEIVSFTSVGNQRSRRVMERLGMTHDPRENFQHPRLPPAHPLAEHVLYRIRRSGSP